MRNFTNHELSMIKNGTYFSGRIDKLGSEIVVVKMDGGWVVAERYENRAGHPNGSHSLSTKLLFADRSAAIRSAQFGAFYDFPIIDEDVRQLVDSQKAGV